MGLHLHLRKDLFCFSEELGGLRATVTPKTESLGDELLTR